ncbi:Endonuclease/exonuclease/phosphatase [Trema orientale]|uniref:Endonuclease/exonuclease/phosphatase n=1 Tax=Trema orientale TaxID=63057 RepID=A0A2P5G1V5_TREOI|nr:Endonuclease/exonuclease/phosphatase [Trema orientale]
MKIISWNARGLGNASAIRHLKLLNEQQQRPQVLFLIETKLALAHVLRLRNLLNFHNGFEVPRIGLAGGLILLWSDTVEPTILSSSQHHIDCFLRNDDNFRFHFTRFYGEPETHYRHLTWDLLDRLKSVSIQDPWLVMGDFNEILSHEDKSGGSLRSEHSMTAFRNVIDLCCLRPLDYTGVKFTWEKKSPGIKNIKERLDWAMINQHWLPCSKSIELEHLDFYNSDHRALLVSIYDNMDAQVSYVKRRCSRFRFKALWLEEKESYEIIKNAWKDIGSESAMTMVLKNISACSESLTKWSQNKFGCLKTEVYKAQKRVQKLNKEDDTSTEHYSILLQQETILDELLHREEIYWKQRSRVSWIQSGDANTKFFHSKANKRRKANKIKKIQDKYGILVNKDEDIENVIVDYFQNIFTSVGENNEALEQVLHTIDPSITDVMNSKLIRPFIANDVWDAIQSMGPDRSPGQDGISAMFYQQNWSTIGPMVTRAVLDILNNNGDISGQNKAAMYYHDILTLQNAN